MNRLQQIRVKKISVSTRDSELFKKSASDEDCQTVLSESSILLDSETGEPVMIFISQVDHQISDLARDACHAIKNWTVGPRSSGVVSTSKVIGFQPRDYVRQAQAYCHRAALAREQPGVHGALVEVSRALGKIYTSFLPDYASHHIQTISSQILPQWRMKESLFTSGIVNSSNPLVYHFDAGNIEGLWSAMIVVRDGVLGGNLLLPDYGLRILTGDRSAVLFNGQRDLHGVSRIKKIRPDGYRYSVVYYATKALCRCGTAAHEIEHARQSRDETEKRRALGATKIPKKRSRA